MVESVPTQERLQEGRPALDGQAPGTPAHAGGGKRNVNHSSTIGNDHARTRALEVQRTS